MKRRLLVLWMAMVVGMALLSMCGGARVGYQGGYARSIGPGQRGYSGGVAAGWDTLVVIFSPETLVAVPVYIEGVQGIATNPTGIDTFGISTSTPLATDTARVHFLNDVLLGRGAQSWRADNGDAATFVKLGAGGVTSFAYANISNYSPTAADTLGYINASGDRVMLQSATSFVTDGVRVLDLSFPQILRKSELVYIPVEDYVPANSTIISAAMHVSMASAPGLVTYTDTIIAQPLHPAWDKWMLVKDVGSADNLAHAAWTSQESTGPSGAWGGTTRYPWVPDLDYLPKLWDVSKVSDWTTNMTADIPEKSNFPISLTNTFQSFVNGAPNTGFMVNLADNNAFTMSIVHFRWDASTTATRRMPAVIVKYTTKRYRQPYGTADWAFLLGTDDAIKACNDSLTTILANRGMKYTINAANTFLDGVGFGTTADLLRWHDMGHEIASHTLSHPNPLGMNKFTIANAPYAASDTIGASWDSLRVEMSPEWMYARADAAGRDLRSSPNFAKSLALPNNTWNPWVVKLAGQIGYRAVRVGAMTAVSVNGALGTYAKAQLGAADTDTARTAFGSRSQRAPRNMVLLPTSQIMDQVVGLKANTAITEAQVKNNMSRAVWQARGDGRNVLHLFFHDFKTSPTNPGYSEGVDPEEIRWMLDVVTLYGGRTMTQSEFTTWNMAGALPVDTPPAMSQNALFRFEAADNVWFKPNGIDNRWIRGVRTPQAVINSFDTIAPSAPTLSVASGSNNTALLVWAASSSPDVQYYNVYRYFDGASAVKIGTATGIYYYDTTAVNGSPHNYYVKAVDYAGNESAASATMTTTPGTILSLAGPAYFGFWYQDAADSTPLSDADVSKLAAYDAVVCSPHPLELNNETGYDNLVTRVRATNPDAIMLTYFDGLTPWHDWGVTFPAGSSGKRIWDYCISAAADSGAFAKDISGDVVHGDVYPNQMFYNVMNTTLADTIASILVDVIQQTGVDGEYTGFFIDDADTLLADWICNGGECGDFIDYDQDTVAFNADADEKAAVQNWHIDFARAMRREFAEHNMPNRLLVPNGSWGRSADPSPKQAAYMGLIDGYLNENWNQYWPGHAIATDMAKWDLALGMASQLTHAQTSPPLVFWSARTDSSDQFMNEVISMATAGFVGANNSSDIHGTTGVPVMGRRIAALEPSGSASIQYGEVAANASPDTLAVTRGNLVGRMILGRANPDSAAFVWPYVIYTATGDTLSRSLYWERAGEEGAPPVAQSQILTGDRMLTLAIGAGVGDYVPSDFSHFLIAREYKISSTAYYDTFTVDPDTLDSVYGSTGSWWWYDTGLTNGRQYKYKVFSVDVLSNVGTPAPQVTQTPNDNTPPAVPSGLVASGGDGFVDLDWSFPVTAADFAYFRLWRALGDGAFALHDSVEISAHQDSTAISGQDYRYKVVSVDDDWNASLPSSIATGAWIGSPPATYLAPQLVRVIQNYTATATAVLVYPPNDVTGLTGYTVYRGPWNGIAATDTTVCIKRISINATPDAFNAHTFIDNTANTTPDSAFQYTAVALYSGNRSKKYSPPAGAFTDGGFAVTTPTLAAFGNGTNILLAVGSVSGADSTRVYRGTGAGTQTSLASINALDNPYTDTTAAANTDYWYKVRQYDVATAQWSNYSAVSGPVRWTSVPSGDPAISGVTGGSLSHGETVTISGTNFGFKSQGPPLIWETFESGSNGQLVRDVVGWQPYSENRGGAIYSTLLSHGGANSVYSDALVYGDYFGSNKATVEGAHDILFSSCWWRTNNVTVGDDRGLIKLTRFSTTENWYQGRGVPFISGMSAGSGGGGSQSPQVGYYNSSAVEVYTNVGPGGAYLSAPFNAWTRVDLASQLSTAGASDGWIWGAITGPTSRSVKAGYSIATRGSGQTFQFKGILLPTMSTNQYAATPYGDYQLYCDDVYVDNTLARVEIGNESTYDECTHLEIQIPSAWSATSVTINANTGSFANGAAYLFVIDEDGTASAGQAITISN